MNPEQFAESDRGCGCTTDDAIHKVTCDFWPDVVRAENEHECGRDFDPGCSGCITAMSDAYGSDRSGWPV